MVKFESGTVNKPVTQVTDVAVKKRSRRGMSTVRDIGSARKIVPMMIVASRPSNILLPGENRYNFLVPIVLFPSLRP